MAGACRIVLGGLLLVMVCTAPAGESSPLVMWNRDLSASFPEASIPVTFDGTTGANILWKTRLPNWSNASPIVSDGRVYLTVEPWTDESWSPWLFCIDAASGNELWRRELDAVATFPAGEQESARATMREARRLLRLRGTLMDEAVRLSGVDASKLESPVEFDVTQTSPEIRAAWQRLIERSKELGGRIKPPGKRFTLKKLFFPYRGGRALELAASLDLPIKTWYAAGTYTGLCLATPCSDGERVWTLTIHNLHSCHDRDGNLLWQVRFPYPTLDDVAPEQRDRVPDRWCFRLPKDEFSTSPLLVDLGRGTDARDLVLVTRAGNMLRCLDADDGIQRWHLVMPACIGQNMSIPGVARVDGVPVLVDIGNPVGKMPDLGVELIRLSDGVPVGRLPAYFASKNAQTSPIIHDGSLVVGRPKDARTDLAAYRLSWNDDSTRIEYEVVWQQPIFKSFRPWRSTWHDGILYSGDQALELDTGALLEERANPRAASGRCTFLAGDVLGACRFGGKWARRHGNAEFIFYDRKTGAFLGVGRLPMNPEDGVDAAHKLREEFQSRWRWLGGATPWAAGDRLYIRSYDFLWCVGKE